MWQLPRGAEEREALPPTFCGKKRERAELVEAGGRARGLDDFEGVDWRTGRSNLMTVADWNVRAAYTVYIYRVINNRNAAWTTSLNKE